MNLSRLARSLAHSLALLPALWLAGCGKPTPPTYQGYAEGEFVYVASPLAGRLDHLWVRRGQTIGNHTPLFALEAADELAAQQQAQQQLQASEAQLADLRLGKRPAELAVVRAQLAQARANARQADLQYRRDAGQFKLGGISQAQLEASRAVQLADDAKVRELSSQLAVARLPARADQIRAQTAQVAAARAALAQATWKLDQKTVGTTQAGLVFDTLYRVGEWVPAGSPVVSLLPPGNIKIRFFVPESVVGALRIGRAIAVHCDGCGAAIPARLTYISTEAEYTPPVIYSNETRAKLVFMVEARPDKTDAPRLHPGQPLEVTLR
ncbi:secretion protein HlyD [Pandoraea thiooxydans]|uniref:Secretion protein HlyD n=1 Tax=Pandoraea thiooxydans TaxID=445709 RepID=A0A0G3EU76_9BURK|nr:secretion protein HlyD [Pandoraea thiooxydans]